MYPQDWARKKKIWNQAVIRHHKVIFH